MVPSFLTTKTKSATMLMSARFLNLLRRNASSRRTCSGSFSDGAAAPRLFDSVSAAPFADETRTRLLRGAIRFSSALIIVISEREPVAEQDSYHSESADAQGTQERVSSRVHGNKSLTL